jgi:hypothetical protein
VRRVVVITRDRCAELRATLARFGVLAQQRDRAVPEAVVDDDELPALGLSAERGEHPAELHRGPSWR